MQYLWWKKWHLDRFFPPSTSVVPCQFHSTGVPLHKKMEKKLVIFITGLQKKPQGCGASVASAAGPFTPPQRTPCVLMLVQSTQLLIYILYPVQCDKVRHLCNTNKCTSLYFIRTIFYIAATCFGIIISHRSHAIQYTPYRDGIQFGSRKNRCLYTKI